MQLTLLKGKLHQATVTGAELDYEGSVAIDEALLEAAGMLPYEQVDIYNITNGNRFTTYTIVAPRGSRTISVQGAAAHQVEVGDRVIICAYARMSEAEAKGFEPKKVFLDEVNHIKDSGVGDQDSVEYAA